MKGKTCCVTGHRDLPQNEINKIKTALAHEIDAAVTDGFTCFMSGFADGVDQYFVELEGYEKTYYRSGPGRPDCDIGCHGRGHFVVDAARASTRSRSERL